MQSRSKNLLKSHGDLAYAVKVGTADAGNHISCAIQEAK
jgi:hypothetical protein